MPRWKRKPKTPPNNNRQKHPIKEWEQLLKRIEAHGWRVTRNKGYFIAWCPCGKHHKSIPLTPSGTHTLLNTTKWIKRQSCWKDT